MTDPTLTTAHLELEQARHERNARRTVGQYVPWSKLLMTLTVVLALLVLGVLAGCKFSVQTAPDDGMPPGTLVINTPRAYITVTPVTVNGAPCIVASHSHGVALSCDWSRR